MKTKIGNRRRIRRYRVDKAGTANIEFRYPGPNGKSFVLPLIDLSIAGFSFKLEEPLSGLDNGSTIEDVVVRLGDCEIKGEVLVMYFNDEYGREASCGALFYPESESELVKLKCVVAGIEALQRD